MTFHPRAIFARSNHFEGVRRINIFLLKLLYVLMFFVLSKEVWTHSLTHKGAREPADTVAWCVWAAFATLAGLGILHPVKMLPIFLLEIFYKVLWLALVAYPLWSSKGTLEGSQAEAITAQFLWVVLPIVVVPWRYAFATYVHTPKRWPCLPPGKMREGCGWRHGRVDSRVRRAGKITCSSSSVSHKSPKRVSIHRRFWKSASA